jgi:hypothetical protein
MKSGVMWRGIQWVFYRGNEHAVYVQIYARDQRGDCLVGSGAYLQRSTFWQKFRNELWPTMLAYMRVEGLVAMDGVPWEIHAIEDLGARAVATRAYLNAVQAS